VCYVLIDNPRYQWLVYEDVAGAYLTYYAQISKARQLSSLYASRRANPRKRSGSLL
jgi:hypothetical protein